MGGNWSGCCVGDMALRLMVMVEVPEGVTRGGGVVVTALVLPAAGGINRGAKQGGGKSSAACQTPEVERAGENPAILGNDRQKQNKDQWQKHANPCWRTELPGR